MSFDLIAPRTSGRLHLSPSSAMWCRQPRRRIFCVFFCRLPHWREADTRFLHQPKFHVTALLPSQCKSYGFQSPNARKKRASGRRHLQTDGDSPTQIRRLSPKPQLPGPKNPEPHTLNPNPYPKSLHPRTCSGLTRAANRRGVLWT